jgi:PAS domain S-box-containing protein
VKTQRIRLLLVEDDMADQLAFERFVKKENLSYDYLVAESISKAKKILQSDTFDIVVSDYMLGDGTAFDVLEMVKDAPIIVMTGTGDEETAVKAMKMGAYDYLVKDVAGAHLKILPIMVENTLEKRHSEQELKQYRENLEVLVKERTIKLVLEIERRKHTEEEQSLFSQKLTALLETINKLSKSTTFDGLCRRAVELAKPLFNFDRVGIWFFLEDRRTMQGSFGTDEKGRLRDERNGRLPIYDRHVKEILKRREPVLIFDNQALYDNKGNIVGKGDHVVAGLWNGEKAIGIFGADNLIHKHPITDSDKKLLSLYAASLGHLCTIKRAEESLYIKNNAIESFITATGITTLDGRVEYVNAAFIKLFGYNSAKEILGKQIEQFDPTGSVVQSIKMMMKTGSVSREVTIKRKDSSMLDTIISISKVADAKGRPIRLMASFVDISDRKKYEKKLVASISEKETLLKEIHHRVKNNMQVIVSLLNLQSIQIKDQRIRAKFKESQERIYSMALVHEMLYGSENLSSINFREYIRNLAHNLYQSYGADPERIKFELDAEDIALSIDDAIPCGLILQELISNTLKYAFPEGRKIKGKIHIRFRRSAGRIELSVADNGVGLPVNEDYKKTKSLGLNLVSLLGRDQLAGSFQLERRKGTKFTLRFRESSLSVGTKSAKLF